MAEDHSQKQGAGIAEYVIILVLIGVLALGLFIPLKRAMRSSASGAIGAIDGMGAPAASSSSSLSSDDSASQEMTDAHPAGDSSSIDLTQ